MLKIKLFFIFIIFLLTINLYADDYQQMLLARIYIENNNYEKAERIIKSLYENSPDDINLQMELANIYIQLGYYNKALVLFNKILEKDNNNTDAIHQKIFLLTNIKKKFSINYEFRKTNLDKNKSYLLNVFFPLKKNYYTDIIVKYNDQIKNNDNDNFKYIGINLINNRFNKQKININIGYNKILNTDIIQGSINFTKTINYKYNFDVSLFYNNIWNEQLSLIKNTATYHSIRFSNYNELRNNIFISYESQYQKFYFDNNRTQYGNSFINSISIGKHLYYNSGYDNSHNNFCDISLNFYKTKSDFNKKYQNIISLINSVNQFSLNLNFGLWLNNKIFTKSVLFTAYDKPRDINVLDSYGMNFDIFTIISNVSNFTLSYSYATENTTTDTGKSYTLSCLLNIFY